MFSQDTDGDNAGREDISSQLQQKHLAAVNSRPDWLAIWEMFCDDRWFRKCLAQCARRCARAGPDPPDDIEQEALMLFGNELQAKSDLGFDAGKGDYYVFLRKILFRCCKRAAERLNRYGPDCLQWWKVAEAAEPYTNDHPVNLAHYIEQLPTRLRIIAWLHFEGVGIPEIARAIGRTRRTGYRLVSKMLDELRKIVDGEQPPYS